MKDYLYWTLAVNPVQITLGTLSVVCKRIVSRWCDLTSAELQEWQEISRQCERALFKAFHPDRLNEMQMVRDGRPVMLIVPRYKEERIFLGKCWRDASYGALSAWKEEAETPDMLQELSQALQIEPVKEKSVMTFYFVRHGDTDWSQKGILEGSKNLPINAAGQLQAHTYRKKMAGLPFDLGCASDTLRAEETASIILGNRTLIKDRRLCEREWGNWAGKPVTDYKKASHQELSSVESSESIALRLFGFMNEMVVIYPEVSRTLVVTHSDVMRVLVAKLLGFSNLDAEIGITSDSFIKVTALSGRFRLERMDSVLLPTILKFSEIPLKSPEFQL